MRLTGFFAGAVLAAGVFLPGVLAAGSPARVRTTTSFDPGWRFFKGDANGAEVQDFDDSKWQTVNVPHDWAIDGPFGQNNPTGRGGGYLPSGVSWYRKHFTLPAKDANRRVFIEFDGVMANSEVWINGVSLGKRPYGYVSFEYEMTGHLNFGSGKTNVLAVRSDTSQQPASRWYEGAGIYRHVRLLVTDPVHVEEWSTFVTTPEISSKQATVHVKSTVVNQSDSPRQVALEVEILGPGGKNVQTAETAPQTLEAGKSADFDQDIVVANPEIWDLDHPALYQALAKVRAGKSMLDDDLATFGIRQVRFDAATGFWLNGKNFKLKGVCLHADGGDMGIAIPLGVWQRRIELLKEIGVNAIRTAHNPPDPGFLDLCDRMGVLVMDEMFDCWTVGKNKYDYHLYFNEWSKIDARDSVRRDRNHPSIVIYSAGNEIHDTPKAELAKGILKGLLEVMHEADPTRPVTMALFRPNASHDYEDGLADMLDVVGQNYRENEILAAHQQKPTRKILGTENQQGREVWVALRDNPPYAGQFLWAGIDYLGEAVWPNVSSRSGLLERTGRFKAAAYQRQSWWSEKPMVHIVRAERRTGGPSRRGFTELYSNWTPRDAVPAEAEVEVYSNCQEVELVLNGKSLGSKNLPADASPRIWQVPFEAGTLKAIGRNNDDVVATDELRTAGKPAKIVLVADHSRLGDQWDDVDAVTVKVVDANGVPNPWADDLITFHVTGPGTIAAVDNGDPQIHDSFHTSERHLYQGQCVATLKATRPSGRITLSASASGLTGASVTIEAAR